MLPGSFRSHALVALSLGAALAACGGQSQYPPGSSADGNGSSSNGNSSNPTSAQVSAYCSAYQSYVQTCGITSPCTQAIDGDCATYASDISSGFLGAAISCGVLDSCTESNDTDACLQAAFDEVAPSTAQQKVATDYCAVCAGTVNETAGQCVTAFLTEDSTTSGANVLEYDDAIATAIDMSCVPASSSGCGDFFDCMEGVIGSELPAVCQAQENISGGIIARPTH